MSIARNVEFLRHFPNLNGFGGLSAHGGSALSAGRSPLIEVTGFGSNPGALKMFTHVPETSPRASALVVVLHGCGQTANGYDIGTGWSALANRYGFALLMPEQQSGNNPNTCFNWFNPGDIARGRGEAASIRQMVSRMVNDHKLDPRRVYVTGLSAGGAMTSVMLAAYPDVFAGGAIIAGLPYGIAGNVREALGSMMQPSARPADVLGDLVRKASKHKGPWPKVSVWHGTADRTVSPGNANEIIKQWLDVHGLPAAPMSTGEVGGHPREVWWNADGETIVESYTITDMGHGTPLGLAGTDERYGAEGAFMLEAGIASSYHIAGFFGLTGRVTQPVEAVVEDHAPSVAPVVKSSATESLQSIDLAARLWSRSHKPVPPPKPAATEPKRGIDISAVITRALTAAGLMK